jgi:hypothetical protein
MENQSEAFRELKDADKRLCPKEYVNLELPGTLFSFFRDRQLEKMKREKERKRLDWGNNFNILNSIYLKSSLLP